MKRVFFGSTSGQCRLESRRNKNPSSSQPGAHWPVLVPALLHYNGDGVVLHMGALCESSNAVTIVARHYSNNKDDNKELHSVLFLEGYQRSK